LKRTYTVTSSGAIYKNKLPNCREFFVNKKKINMSECIPLTEKKTEVTAVGGYKAQCLRRMEPNRYPIYGKFATTRQLRENIFLRKLRTMDTPCASTFEILLWRHLPV